MTEKQEAILKARCKLVDWGWDPLNVETFDVHTCLDRLNYVIGMAQACIADLLEAE